MSEESTNDRDPEDRFSTATEAIESVWDRLAEVDTLDDLGGDAARAMLEDVEGLVEVVDELEDLFDTLDLDELREAIDGEDLIEAIRLGEVPEALTDRDEGLDDVVNVSQLLDAVDLLDAWSGSDLHELWQDTEELGDAVDDVTDGDEGADGEEQGGGDDDGLLDEESRLTDEEGDLFDTDVADVRDSFDVASDPALYQTVIQQQANEGIEALRDSLLRVHGTFDRLYEFNREKMRRQDTSTNSRNPTAVSTLPVERADLGSGGRYSTIRPQVKYSTAPSHTRIYGERFERERKKRGYE